LDKQIEVIATSISGSIRDWGKVKRIVPLFAERGVKDVTLHVTDSHLKARKETCVLVQAGRKIIISAGGSGTFNAVLEGCYDAGVDLTEIRLGFLRKGSADLIGKVLKMPDEIEPAISVFVESISRDRVVSCDVIQVTDLGGISKPRRFVGYSGAEIFGDIPYFTENRFIKYYKGVLSQLFGDLGPFFVGMMLATIRHLFCDFLGNRRRWKIIIDGESVTEGIYQAMMILNGDLGPNLPLARGIPLGSRDFYLFTIRDLGFFRLIQQMRHAWNASILEDQEKWGFESHRIRKTLELIPDLSDSFPLNVDGSTMRCRRSVRYEIIGQVHLLAG